MARTSLWECLHRISREKNLDTCLWGGVQICDGIWVSQVTSFVRFSFKDTSFALGREAGGSCQPQVEGLRLGHSPGGRKREPLTPPSFSRILRTPGAVNHLSTSALATTGPGMVPGLLWSWWTNISTFIGVPVLRGMSRWYGLSMPAGARLQKSPMGSTPV